MDMERQLELIPNGNAKYITPEEIRKCSGHTVVLDVETTGLQWYKDKIIGVGIHCPTASVSGYFPTYSDPKRKAAIEAVASWEPGTWVLGHNVKFDLHFLLVDSHVKGWNLLDTTVMAHLVDSRQKKSLDALAEKYLGKPFKKEYKERGRKKPIHEWPVSLVAEYCLHDCMSTYDLAKILMPIVREIGCMPLFTLQMKYIARIWQVEHRGTQLDEEYMDHAISILTENSKKFEKDLMAGVGYDFNWRSNKLLSKALYEDMGIPKPKNPFLDEDGKDVGMVGAGRIKTVYTSSSTSTFLLMEKANHPLGELVMDLREIDKLLGAMENWRNNSDEFHIVHPSFNITGTRTGRLSCNNPNMQNMPGLVRTRATQSAYSGTAERGDASNLRQAFIPTNKNSTMVSVDYKQMEMRMFGLLADDENMLEGLRTGDDVHASVAERVWGVRDSVHREWAKTISFGLIYGMSSGSLQYRLNKTREEALSIANRYWRTFPRIKPWLNEIIEECRTNGFVTYWSGRRWYEDERVFMYKGANATIQGGSHDLLMTAFLRTCDFLDKEYPDVKIFNLVHDELDFEIPDELFDEVVPKLQSIMEVEDLFDLKFFTDVKAGKNYGELEKVAKFG